MSMMLVKLEDIFPFITSERSFDQKFGKLASGVDMGSRLTLSNNQSRATLWVRETCLIVGLLSLMIISNTASLSLKCTTRHCGEKVFHSERRGQSLSNTFRPMWEVSCNLGFSDVSHTVNALQHQVTLCQWLIGMTMTKSHGAKAEMPSKRKPASKDLTSDSAELCEIAVCFLHVKFIGTKSGLPKMNEIPPNVGLESSMPPAKCES